MSGPRITLHPGDNRASLRRLIDQGVRVHSVVTDPPYGLVSVTKRFGGDRAAPAKFGSDGAFARASAGFMGSKWDGTGIERDPEFWALIWEILLPGGYCLAFSGARTGHWQACAMESAGFIMHPMLGWLFGQGFPKAHNAAKAIDKKLGHAGGLIPSGDPVKRMIPGAEQTSSGDWTKTDERDYQPGQYVPATPEAAQWQGWAYGAQSLKPALEPIYVGQKPFSEKDGVMNLLRHGVGALNIDGTRVRVGEWEEEKNLCASCANTVDVNLKHTTPVTKVSSVAPIANTVAPETDASTPVAIDKRDTGCSGGPMLLAADEFISSNTAEFGKTITEQSQTASTSTMSTKTRGTIVSITCACCGGSSIVKNTGSAEPEKKISQLDENKPVPTGRENEPSANRRYTDSGSTNFAAKPGPRGGSPQGRHPANLLHDGSPEVVAMFPDSKGQLPPVGPTNGPKNSVHCYGNFGPREHTPPRNDGSGSAARFFNTFPPDADPVFYHSKATKADRAGSSHPTVKPIALMRWLVRLATPPGGTVLDPFGGSGTTGAAALAEGFDCVLMEAEDQFVADIRARFVLPDPAADPFDHLFTAPDPFVELFG